jgi:Arc/MetJ-type ribon-helix-helix transcriptional regulator
MAEMEKTEKITINLGLVDLGEIDLLVGEGFYANRTDFIRSAIRRQLESRSSAVKDSVARRTLELGSVTAAPNSKNSGQPGSQCTCGFSDWAASPTMCLPISRSRPSSPSKSSARFEPHER